jgi:hypothetical protein
MTHQARRSAGRERRWPQGVDGDRISRITASTMRSLTTWGAPCRGRLDQGVHHERHAQLEETDDPRAVVGQ